MHPVLREKLIRLLQREEEEALDILQAVRKTIRKGTFGGFQIPGESLEMFDIAMSALAPQTKRVG